MRVSPLVLSFLLSLMAEINCYPYVSFMGQTLGNHSYVDLGRIGDNYFNSSDSLQCHTDLSTCCGHPQGPHRGDWFFPDGTGLPFSGLLYESRWSRLVVLRRRTTATGPTGIYRCDIPTIALHHDTDVSVRDTFYVGLYITGEGNIVMMMTFLSVNWHCKLHCREHCNIWRCRV